MTNRPPTGPHAFQRRAGRRLPRAIGVALLLGLATAGPAWAQPGVLTGRVVDGELGEPIPAALVEVIAPDGQVARYATTDNNGLFRISGIPRGTYTLAISSIGYERMTMEGVEIGQEPVSLDDVRLVSRAFQLNPVVVTASREREKALDAPASVHTVDSDDVEDTPATTTVDHLRGVPGVDIVTNGLAQHNVVARGFNDVFSASLFVLTDNRWASVPSLRFNAYNLIPVTNEDIERIEVVLGPGSALYGPNTDQGVMHIITKSPLQTQETVLSVTGGEREIFKGTFRHAGLFTEDIGYKISGMYFRGNDWKFTDPVEAENAALADDCLANLTLNNPACVAFATTPGQPPSAAQLRRVGRRNFDSERFSGTGRLDFRFDERSTVTLDAGVTKMLSSIEMTGIGSAQADDWTYSYLQARLDHGDLFAQAYLNLSNAGDTYILRDGSPIVDNSLLYVGQVQHAANLGDRQRFIYGADLIQTVPRTDGTINGRNEDDDGITEIGSYVQSETDLSEQFRLVAAARLDHHNRVDELVFSPRAALVYRPVEGQNLRATWNRAFSQPSANNLFLDISASPTLGPFSDFAVRASGVPEDGFNFARDCPGPAGTRLCMRSPFNANPSDLLALDVTPFWQDVVDGLAALVAAGEVPALGSQLDPDLASLLRSLDPSDAVGTRLREVNPTTGEFSAVDPENVKDVAPMEPTITNTFEAGYKGIVGDRLLVNVDVYYQRIEDFIGPLLVETPSAFMEPQDLGAFLGDTLAAEGYSQGEILSVIGGLANVPLGTVTPENPPNPDRPADLFLTYRNFGELDIWGSDIAVTYLVTDQLSLSGSYSFVNENIFRNLDGVADVPLNAPQNKASLGLKYRNAEQGISAEVRGRYSDSFPANFSDIFVGHIESYTLFDAKVTYRLPFAAGTEVTLSAQNVFDNKHQEIIGAPSLGRIVFLRLRHVF